MALIQTGENPAMDPNTRASCYEAIATVTCYSAKDVHPALQNLAIHVLDRLEKTIATQAQLLGGDDRRAHHEIQANLCNVLTSVLRKLNKEISPAADRIMQDVLTVMSGASAGSTVMEDAFLVVGALTSCKPPLCLLCIWPLFSCLTFEQAPKRISLDTWTHSRLSFSRPCRITKNIRLAPLQLESWATFAGP